MSSQTVSLIVAVVGVLGTLASAVVAQWFTLHGDRQRRVDRAAAEKRRYDDQLRHCYVELNRRDRAYRDAMVAYAYALRDCRLTEKDKTDLSSARAALGEIRAEAQMLVSDKVLKAEGEVYWRLANAYGDLMHFEKEHDPEVRHRSLQELIHRLDGTMQQLRDMRALMRADLGIEATSEFPT